MRHPNAVLVRISGMEETDFMTKKRVLGVVWVVIVLIGFSVMQLKGISEKVQPYKEAFGGALLVCAGILALLRPQMFRWPANSRYRVWFPVLAIVLGLSMAASRMTVWQCGTHDPWSS